MCFNTKMPIHLLDCQPAELLRACYEQATEVGPDEIRAYLPRKFNVLAQDHVSWAGLIDILLRDGTNNRAMQENDVGLVFAYLQSIALWFGQQDFASESWSQPGSLLGMKHDALDDVLKLLVMTGRMQEMTLIPELFDQYGWNPEELLVHLQCTGFNVGEPQAFVHVVQSALLLGQSFMMHTSWMPKHQHLWAALWPLHAPQEYGSWDRYHKATGLILSKIPATLPSALRCLADGRNSATQQHGTVEAYFPLRLEQCEPKAFVNGLGVLMESAMPEVRARVEELLRTHHPQLSEIMAMHYTLVAQPCGNFDHLEIALRQSLGQELPAPAAEPNMGVLFEDVH